MLQQVLGLPGLVEDGDDYGHHDGGFAAGEGTARTVAEKPPTMKHTNTLWACLLAVLMTFGLSLVVAADDDEPALEHPLRVLKARYEANSGRSGIGYVKGRCTVWVQNVTDVLVDGVKIEVVLYNKHNRKIDSQTKDIGEMEPGKKLVTNFDYDVMADDNVKPRIWVYYNGGGDEPTKFEGEPPVWN